MMQEGACNPKRSPENHGVPTGAVHRQDHERLCEDETTIACDPKVKATVALPQVQHDKVIVSDMMP